MGSTLDHQIRKEPRAEAGPLSGLDRKDFGGAQGSVVHLKFIQEAIECVGPRARPIVIANAGLVVVGKDVAGERFGGDFDAILIQAQRNTVIGGGDMDPALARKGEPDSESLRAVHRGDPCLQFSLDHGQLIAVRRAIPSLVEDHRVAGGRRVGGTEIDPGRNGHLIGGDSQRARAAAKEADGVIRAVQDKGVPDTARRESDVVFQGAVMGAAQIVRGIIGIPVTDQSTGASDTRGDEVKVGLVDEASGRIGDPDGESIPPGHFRAPRQNTLWRKNQARSQVSCRNFEAVGRCSQGCQNGFLQRISDHCVFDAEGVENHRALAAQATGTGGVNAFDFRQTQGAVQQAHLIEQSSEEATWATVAPSEAQIQRPGIVGRNEQGRDPLQLSVDIKPEVETVPSACDAVPAFVEHIDQGIGRNESISGAATLSCSETQLTRRGIGLKGPTGVVDPSVGLLQERAQHFRLSGLVLATLHPEDGAEATAIEIEGILMGGGESIVIRIEEEGLPGFASDERGSALHNEGVISGHVIGGAIGGPPSHPSGHGSHTGHG